MPKNDYFKRGYNLVISHPEVKKLSIDELKVSIKIYSKLDEANEDYVAGMIAGLNDLLSRQAVAVWK